MGFGVCKALDTWALDRVAVRLLAGPSPLKIYLFEFPPQLIYHPGPRGGPSGHFCPLKALAETVL
jgi:hypothetical protein